MTTIELVQSNNWQVGDRLVGDEGLGPTVIQITAIGEENILARRISQRGKPINGPECTWSLECREWTKVIDNDN